jgi:hypothetical protein
MRRSLAYVEVNHWVEETVANSVAASTNHSRTTMVEFSYKGQVDEGGG